MVHHASKPFLMALALLTIGFLSSFPLTAENSLVGLASIIDGDTIEIHGERVRFNGIDAPESDQTCKNADGRSYRCGQASAAALDVFLSASQPVRCEYVERDSYGRFIGNCFRADGEDISSWLVRHGHALDWPRYSRGAYASQEAEARRLKFGMWQGEFISPWEWRSARREPSPLRASGTTASSKDCTIKGNISRKGERIHHVPGQRHYTDTQINEAAGERWFCSEDEARAAGWRRSQK